MTSTSTHVSNAVFEAAMEVQVVFPGESATARIAQVRSSRIMDAGVTGQVVLPLETQVTHMAGKDLSSLVDRQHVSQ